MLINSGLSKKFWAEAIRFATVVENSAPTKAVEEVTPFEKWNGKTPDLSKLRIFGCKYLVLDHEHTGKFNLRAQEMIYLDPATGGDGHRLFNSETNKYSASRDVHFFELRVKISSEHVSFAPSPYVVPDTTESGSSDADEEDDDADTSDSDYAEDKASDSDSNSDFVHEEGELSEDPGIFQLPSISITNTGGNRSKTNPPLMQNRNYIPLEYDSEGSEYEGGHESSLRQGQSNSESRSRKGKQPRISLTNTDTEGRAREPPSPLCNDRDELPSPQVEDQSSSFSSNPKSDNTTQGTTSSASKTTSKNNTGEKESSSSSKICRPSNHSILLSQ